MSVWQMYFASFKGRNRFFVILVNFEIIIIFALFILCWVKLFQVDEMTMTAFRWGIGAILSMIMIGFLKMWLWSEMNKLAGLRETKRLELQLARLVEKMEG